MLPPGGSALTERNGRYVLELENTYFEVDPAVGARVTSLRCAGAELLTDRAVHPENYGSTFWSSPQADWSWPPMVEIDSGPYTGAATGNSVTLKSAVASRNGLAIGVTKKFSADLAREAIDIEYAIRNEGSAPRRIAPWEITRVPPDGLTFYPSGGAPRGNGLPLPVTVEVAGHTWFRYDPATVTDNQKLFADGAGGWIAHAASGVILIKTFPEVPAALQAPGEAEIEIYANVERTYVEVEQQGALTLLEPGQSASWPVRWYARRLPRGVSAEVGSAALIAFVNETIN